MRLPCRHRAPHEANFQVRHLPRGPSGTAGAGQSGEVRGPRGLGVGRPYSFAVFVLHVLNDSSIALPLGMCTLTVREFNAHTKDFRLLGVSFRMWCL